MSAQLELKCGWQDICDSVSRTFTPAVPVSDSGLFGGRTVQVRKLLDSIALPGQHAIIYGERGVGKTSLANVLASRIVTGTGEVVLAPRVNCNTLQTYGHIWREVFDQIERVEQRPEPGFSGKKIAARTPAVSLAGEVADITPGAVCGALAQLADMQQGRPVLVILDEFDRVPNGKAKRAIADTIKTLSDRATPVTLVLVGVATVGDLILEHQSVERAITQVLMPRMETDELHEILAKGTAKLGMKISPKAKERIASLSQGLPSYTHRLALEAARRALAVRRLTIQQDDVRMAVRSVVGDTGESLRETYRRAVASSRNDTLFEPVILACACATADRFGYFATPDVREPMSRIMGKRVDIPAFARHLKQFCETSRGPVLRRDGIERRYRYRFINPLMQPFIIMHGIVQGLLNEDGAVVEGAGSEVQRAA